jgi:uncharacterized protein involved in exopolysaccharide biosynthesis
VQPLVQPEPMAYPSAVQLGARNFGELVKSPAVALRAAKALKKAELEGVFDYRVAQDSSLLQVIADAGSPQGAADEANAVAEALVAMYSEQLQASSERTQKVLTAQLSDLRAQIRKTQADLAAARAQPGGEAKVAEVQDTLDSLQSGYEAVLQSWQVLPANKTLLSTSINVVDRALPDPEQVSPRPILNLGLAVVGGLLLGIALARATQRPVGRRE